jgi:hypothetical protein
MADDPAQQADQQAEGQRQLQLQDLGKPTHYANFFAVGGGRDAVMLTFGNLFGGGGVVQVETKLVLSPMNAKRLAVSLGQLIRRHEERFGEIELTETQWPQEPPAEPQS